MAISIAPTINSKCKITRSKNEICISNKLLAILIKLPSTIKRFKCLVFRAHFKLLVNLHPKKCMKHDKPSTKLECINLKK